MQRGSGSGSENNKNKNIRGFVDVCLGKVTEEVVIFILNVLKKHPFGIEKKTPIKCISLCCIVDYRDFIKTQCGWPSSMHVA